MEEEIRKEFASNSFTLEDEKIAEQCASLCVSLGLKPSELVTSWELFYLNSRMDHGKVEMKNMEPFRQFLQNEQAEAFRMKQTDCYYYSKNDVDMLLDENEDEREERNEKTPSKVTPAKTSNGSVHPTDIAIDTEFAPVTPSTPASGSKYYGSASKSLSGRKSVTPFSLRTNRCTTQFVLNKHLPDTYDNRSKSEEDDVLRRLQPIDYSQLTVLGSNLKPGCRFLYDRIKDKFSVVDSRIKGFADCLARSESLPPHDHVALASQDTVFVVGMVCCDGEGHLNDKSILLQGGVEHSSGHRVRLDLHSLPQYSLFPGQIIGLKGNNPSGHCLVASSIVDCMPFTSDSTFIENSPPSSKRQAVDALLSDQKGSCPLSMVVAAGPFTTSDNLDYEPLTELLSFARKRRPNVLVLLGPFVDSEHPQMKSGALDASFVQVFNEKIILPIKEYCEELGSAARVVLVPSIRDIHHDYVFPQPPFPPVDAHGFRDPEHQITLVGNPCIFKVNEVIVGISTADVLRHLSSEEISRVPAGGLLLKDRLARLASHIISQRSFYPLFPAFSGVPLDLSLSSQVLTLPTHPHVLILPSDLSPFAKILPCSSTPSQEPGGISTVSTICINPGRLAKGINGGTFSDFHLLPSEYDENSGLDKRARVSIMKI